MVLLGWLLMMLRVKVFFIEYKVIFRVGINKYRDLKYMVDGVKVIFLF